MPRITGSHLICKALKLEGVKNIFGLAGDHILPVLDTMADQEAIGGRGLSRPLRINLFHADTLIQLYKGRFISGDIRVKSVSCSQPSVIRS